MIGLFAGLFFLGQKGDYTIEKKVWKLHQDYIDIAKGAGFDVEILGEDKDISKRQYDGVDLESLKLKLVKRVGVEEVKYGCCCDGKC